MKISFPSIQEPSIISGIDSKLVLGKIPDRGFVTRFAEFNQLGAPSYVSEDQRDGAFGYWDERNSMEFTVDDLLDIDEYDLWKRTVKYQGTGRIDDSPEELLIQFIIAYDMSTPKEYSDPGDWLPRRKKLAADLYTKKDLTEGYEVMRLMRPIRHILLNDQKPVTIDIKRDDKSGLWFISHPYFDISMDFSDSSQLRYSSLDN